MLVLNPSRKNIFEKGKILWKFSEILRKRINWRRDLKRILTDTWKFIFQTTLLPLKIKIEINEKMSQIGIILIELEFVVIGQLGGKLCWADSWWKDCRMSSLRRVGCWHNWARSWICLASGCTSCGTSCNWSCSSSCCSSGCSSCC